MLLGVGGRCAATRSFDIGITADDELRAGRETQGFWESLWDGSLNVVFLEQLIFKSSPQKAANKRGSAAAGTSKSPMYRTVLNYLGGGSLRYSIVSGCGLTHAYIEVGCHN